jgi:peptidoglycan hydrolase-like protein with peptidoglycan-binding domain
MRTLIHIAIIIAGAGVALAQDGASATTKPAAKPAAAKPATSKPAASKPNAAEAAALKEVYAAMPLAERLAIQSDLAWAGDYSGGITGDFGERAIAAVKSFQKRSKARETGLLTAEERARLAAAVKAQQEQVGWRLVEDDVIPGARLGIPAKLALKSERGASGTRWFSARGEIQIETFREKMAGTQLSALFEEQKKVGDRKVEYGALRPDSFVLSGLQGLKRFHVRAQLRDTEARGLTILYDQAMDGIMEPVVVAMSGAFAPFGVAAPAARTRVDYASGVVVSVSGHIVTERQATEGCNVIVVAGSGNAERIAADEASDLALLRINGAAALRALPLSAEPPDGADLVLVGIPDPQAQGGAGAVSVSPARLRGVEGARVLLDAAPPPGFSGGAALDAQGRFVGMVDINGATAAGLQATAPQPALVPAASIRKFLAAADVAPASGRTDLDTAKTAIRRVICVRK